MKKMFYLLLILSLTQFTGCIVFHTVSYEVTVNDDGTGVAAVLIEDLYSDAATEEAINEDVKSIFEHGWKSQQFLDDMEFEGKIVTQRDLFVENEKLNVKVIYKFKEISRVEGMQFEDPYYYLTIPVQDSIISTNGQISRTNEYQRIIWDKSIKTLKFKMFSDYTGRKELTSLAKYYKKEN